MRSAADRLTATLAFGLMGLFKLLPADAALALGDRLARVAGPLTRRHKLVRYNLSMAFPEKSAREIEALARDSWAGMGRLAVEYVYLDTLLDFDIGRPGEGRIDVAGAERLVDFVANPRPTIFFASHSGFFEIVPMVAAAYGVHPTILYRPPNNPYMAARIDSFRRGRLARLVPSHAGSSLTLARTLSAGGSIAVLVDQKFPTGIATTFFGHPVHTNPLVPKLARQFGCDVVPIHCERLAGNRYRITVEPPLSLPKDPAGKVDADAVAQMLNDKVEEWVRQAPGQWLWYHDRWNIKRQIGL